MRSVTENKEAFGTLSVFELTSTAIAGLQKDPASPLQCFRVTSQEAAEVQEVMEQTGIYEPHTVFSRLALGRQGYAGRLPQPQTSLVTYGWVAMEATSVGSTGLDFVPPLGDVYLFDFATVFEYRGHGYYPLLLRFILYNLAQQQIRRAWIATAPGNGKSARSIARAGFLKVADTQIIPASYSHPPHVELYPTPATDATLLELGKQSYHPNNLYSF